MQSREVTQEIVKESTELFTVSKLAVFDTTEIVVGQQLGKGGFCDVYELKAFRPSPDIDRVLDTSDQRKARHEVARNSKLKSHRYVAKVLRNDRLTNPKRFHVAAKDIESEAKLLAQLSHPNILKLCGCAIDIGTRREPSPHDHYFLILDRLNETLTDRIEKWKVRDRRLNHPIMRALFDKSGQKQRRLLIERLEAASDIASALEYLHMNRIIYRDLKPSNVGFIGTNGKGCQLFDFGLARFLPDTPGNFLNDTYKLSGKVGTYRFMAPEVSLGQPYNEKADVYGFSHLLYVMLVFHKPYPTYDKQMHRFCVAMGGERPPIYSHWPRAIQDLLKQTWSPKINERPTMSEVNATLKEVISDLSGMSTSCDISSTSIGEVTTRSTECEDVPVQHDEPQILPIPRAIAVTDFDERTAEICG
jgi:serine/threonine protein kinase